MRKYSEGEYDVAANILHIWYPQPVHLADDATIDAFFRETLEEWIRPCPKPPYLLVNYANVSIRPDKVEAYVRNLSAFDGLLLGTFRYGVTADVNGHFTAVAVRLGNLKRGAPPNIFESEAEARRAIAAARRR